MQPERLRLERYSPRHARRWNAFVAASKNGTFLFDRDFMDYHTDRFEDGSWIAFEGEGEDNVAALLPVSRAGDRIVSHGGLTYGGWITDRRMTLSAMLRLFALLREAAAAAGIATMTYKAVPHCYHRLPADEDLYALFANGAGLHRLDATSVLKLGPDAPGWAKGRRHALAKARAAGVTAEISTDLSGFHASLSTVLARHDAIPTHSVAELALLAGRFPDRIRLYAARLGAEPIAHALLFDCGRTVHTQYLAATDTGRATGGLEAIVARIQQQDYADRDYLSFGVSSEHGGQVLNAGLMAQKEMFGARAMACPVYDLAFGR